VEGQKIGRSLGFPTINLGYDGDERGVFVGKVMIGDVWYKAAVNVGGRPTVGDEEVFCEAFLLDFNGDIKKETFVSVELLEKIRAIKKFDNLEALTGQITKDVEFVKNWYI